MRTFIVPVIIGLSASFSWASEAPNVAGVWVVQSGNAVVEITDCGDGTPCGKLAWVEAAPGTQPKDDNNPNPELRGQTLVGSKLLWGFKAKGEKWTSGRIYDAESGKTYKSKMQLEDDGTLQVKGCVGPICQGQTWTPVTLENNPAATAP